MMMELPPSSALKMPESNLLLEFLVVAFNAPPKLRGAHQFFN